MTAPAAASVTASAPSRHGTDIEQLLLSLELGHLLPTYQREGLLDASVLADLCTLPVTDVAAAFHVPPGKAVRIKSRLKDTFFPQP